MEKSLQSFYKISFCASDRAFKDGSHLVSGKKKTKRYSYGSRVILIDVKAVRCVGSTFDLYSFKMHIKICSSCEIFLE